MSAQPLGPALDDAGHPLDQVVLTGISAVGHHGVFEHERRDGQTFVADVVVHLDTRRAAATDDLTRTVHYGELAEQVAAVLAGEPADLVETVAERIAATALADPVVVAVDVTVHKPGAPITVPFGDVAVRVRRDRQKLPAAEPWTPPRTGQHAGADSGAPRASGHTAGHTAGHAVAGPGAAVPADGARSELPTDVSTDEPSDAPERSSASAAGPDRLDEVPPVPVDAVLALGSNLGAPQSTLRAAVADLEGLDGVEVVAVSPLARTAPVGGPSQPDYLNAVVLVRTTLSARGLLRAAQSVEARHGRERDERWGPRTLDVDLITYDSTLAVTDDLELPHPRAHERAFVLQPWAQVAPDAVLPGLGGGPVAALAATAPDRDGVRWLALDWMTAPAHRDPVPGAADGRSAPREDVPAQPRDEATPPPEGATPPQPRPTTPPVATGAAAPVEPPLVPAGDGLLGALHRDVADRATDGAALGGAVDLAPVATHDAAPQPAPDREHVPDGPAPQPAPVVPGAHRLEQRPPAPPAPAADPLDWLPDLPAHPAAPQDAEQRRTFFSPVVPPSDQAAPHAGDHAP